MRNRGRGFAAGGKDLYDRMLDVKHSQPAQTDTAANVLNLMPSRCAKTRCVRPLRRYAKTSAALSVAVTSRRPRPSCLVPVSISSVVRLAMPTDYPVA